MHDIGKIGIPDRILQKPGRLTPEERTTMCGHPAIGASIIGEHRHPLLRLAHDVALTHHEKWDGSGYPRGLRGDDIPLAGRIVALADVFDALTSVRPYKPAWEVDAALAYIREQSGRHFDPRVLGAFEAALPEVLKLRERYSA
jgi:putative two-component system response regulator